MSKFYCVRYITHGGAQDWATVEARSEDHAAGITMSDSEYAGPTQEIVSINGPFRSYEAADQYGRDGD